MPETIEKVARQAIIGAGELIREHIGHIGASSIHDKGPSDYVTVVDRQCEDLIVGLVRSNFPDHHIMAEETANEGLQPGYTWVIDPLDGTTNFIHGFPVVAVSIAVCLEKKPVLGLVLDPIRNELFFAKKDEGAWLNGLPLQARTGFALNKALIATGFPFRQAEFIDDYLRTFKAIFLEVSDIRRAGSAALDLAYVAAGRVDGFWEIGLKAWDIAAGELLVREAGGLVSDFNGEDNHLYTGNIVGGGPKVHEFLLNQVGRWLVPALERRD
jgi:myo-inositol-1(or 4)-monophosphatase